MWGQHPKTGKPIRILQMETSISKNRKTVLWVGPDTPTEARWDRWEVGALGLQYLTPITDILLLCDPNNTESEVAWLRTNKWRDLKMILASKKVLDILGDEELKNMKIGNMICLEEAKEIYPFIGPAWDGTQNDAALIASILLRMTRAFGVHPNAERTLLEASYTFPSPPQLWMISQFYKPPSAARAREIKTCLQKNLTNPLIDKVVLLTESTIKDLPSSPKILQDVVGERLKYSTVIRWIAEKAPANTICVFANSDIYLDDTWKHIWSTALEDKFLSLLRYEATENTDDKDHELFGPRADSQDTWVVLSDSVKTRKWDYSTLDFIFGKAGCDNAINVEMLRAKFLVANPSLTLKTHHLHTSQIRNYDAKDIVDKPMYCYIQPTGLNDMTPLFTLTPSHKLPVVPFARPVLGVKQAHVKTFCSMVTRGEKYSLAADSPNMFTSDPIPIYEVDNIFQMSTGLAYSYSSLYVGKSKAASEAWNKSHLSGLSPSLAVDVGLIAPLPDEYVQNSTSYVLYYLSNILLLREKAGGYGEFWSPRDKPFLNALQLFNWKRKEVPVLPRDEGIQVWCKKGYIMLPSDTNFLTKDHVRVLRETLLGSQGRGWQSEATLPKKCVIFHDDIYCTREFINEFEKRLNGYEVRVIWAGSETFTDTLLGASLVITAGGITSWGWSWLAPKDAHLIQIQNEMEPDADCLHLAAAAELRHSLCLAPKGKIQKGLLEYVLATVGASIPVPPLPSTLPLLIMPKQSSESFFGHSGDSFREMAMMWADKGYVRVVEDKHAHQVWLHGIGHTLLYDRPTYEWLEASPPDEKRYKHGLFGNPAPPPGVGKSWSFWPRRPSMVEELATGTLRSFTERSQTLVLYGKIENATQKKRRPLNWAAACSEFVMPVGGEKAYPFSQREYLEKLGQAKFGLCLPGYGWKCHREVECMAMGCVPIVTSQVDMTNYANPPVKGEHYFVAESPEEARRLATETDEATWVKMSTACRAWWKENSSCDGMWQLTQKLLS